MTQVVIFALIGKLLIFLLQKFPKHSLPIIGRLFREGKLLDDLFSCDLCLGFWLYSGLAFIINVDVTGELFYVPILSEFITGAIVSFIMHLISAGWNAQYQNIIIE
jgi:hypothetical protein